MATPSDFAQFLSGGPAAGTQVVYNPWSETAPNDYFRGTLMPGTTGMYAGATQNFGYGPGQGSQSVTGTRGTNITGYDPNSGTINFAYNFLTAKPRAFFMLVDEDENRNLAQIQPGDPGVSAGDANGGGWMKSPYMSGSSGNGVFHVDPSFRFDPSHHYSIRVALPMEGGDIGRENEPTVLGSVIQSLPSGVPQQQPGQPGGATGGQGYNPTTGLTPNGGQQFFQTKNGYRTIPQMTQELKAAGWPGGEDVATAYARTTGGTVTPVSNQQFGSDLAQGLDNQNAAKASGNQAAFDEAKREFDVTFGQSVQQFQENVRQFNLNNQISVAGLTGTFNGQPTLAAQAQQFGQNVTAAGLTGVFNGQQTLQAQQQAFTQGMAGLTTAAGLQANPFRQAEIMGQLKPLLSGGTVPGFQAPGTTSQTDFSGLGNMQKLIDDIRAGPSGTNSVNPQSVLDSIPTPNKIDSRQYMNMAPEQQQLILSGMQQKYGLSPSNAQAQINATLPGFQAPATFGQVVR